MSHSFRILLIHRDAETARRIGEILNEESIAYQAVTSARAARQLLERGGWDVVIGGVCSPDDPESLSVGAIRAQAAGVPVIAVTRESSVEFALDCLREGATDLLFEPVKREQLVFVIRKVSSSLERGTGAEPATAHASTVFGDSPSMRAAREVLDRAAATTATVLIRGESGTGKELFARAIHERGPRRSKPFVKIDCTSLPENLLESELFGYERGAFTGAVSRKPGRVELADGGTLFLDEIGDLTAPLQAKLLRLLQDRELERLGGRHVIRVDVRILAATHRDLEILAERGEFRHDLFYRLNVLPLWLPPLRARRDDIDALAREFCARFAVANGRPELCLDDGALAVLRSQRWPGNVRELSNFIERLVVFSDGSVLTAKDVQHELSRHVRFTTQAGTSATTKSSASDAGPASSVSPLETELRNAERKALARALRHAGGNRSRAARMLGVSRSTLYLKLAEHGLE